MIHVQVLYPHSKLDMLKNGRTDDELYRLLESVSLGVHTIIVYILYAYLICIVYAVHLILSDVYLDVYLILSDVHLILCDVHLILSDVHLILCDVYLILCAS